MKLRISIQREKEEGEGGFLEFERALMIIFQHIRDGRLRSDVSDVPIGIRKQEPSWKSNKVMQQGSDGNQY